MFSLLVVPRRWFVAGAAALGRGVRSSPARLAKAAYLLAFAAVLYLLLTPVPSQGQFRGLPAVHIPAVPFMGLSPAFSGSAAFAGMGGPFASSFSSSLSMASLSTPPFFIPQFVSMPGAPFQFPLFNLTDTTGLFGLGLLGGFGGFSPFMFSGLGIGSFTNFGTFVGFGGGFSGFGVGLSGIGGITGIGGFATPLGGITGVGGFATPLGGIGGIGGGGGFAGKGFGGFNGRKPL